MLKKILFITVFLTVSTMLISGCSSSSSGGSASGTEEGFDYTTDYANDPDFATRAAAGQENPELAARLDGANIPDPLRDAATGKFKTVHFGFDSFKILPEDEYLVREVAAYMAANPSTVVELEGHCDKRGTAEYNLALGNYRARSVAGALVKSGVAARRITTVSYGAELPLDPGNNETAFAKNRRVHFVIYSK